MNSCTESGREKRGTVKDGKSYIYGVMHSFHDTFRDFPVRVCALASFQRKLRNEELEKIRSNFIVP